jgi:cytoskeletal protein CcmA (bactofilin family)
MTKKPGQSTLHGDSKLGVMGMFFKRSKKANGRAAEPPPPPSEATFISRDMRVDGNLNCDGELHIDGRVNGSIRAHVCLVDANANVTGDISADTVYIYGEVNGPVDAGNVHIYASAHVRGDVTNDTISIENGAVIHGSIRNGRTALQSSSSFNGSTIQSGSLFSNFDQSYNSNVDPQDYRPVKVVNPRG